MLKSIVAAIVALLATISGVFQGSAASPAAVQSPAGQTAAASLTQQQYPTAPEASSASGVPDSTNNTTQQFQALSSQQQPSTPPQQKIGTAQQQYLAASSPDFTNYISAAALIAQLNSLEDWVRGYVALATSTPATTQISQQVAAGGNGYPFAVAQAISNLSNITVSHVSGLAASDIPALAYLPSSGGTVSGNLTVTGAFNGGALTLNNASTTLFSASGPAYFGSSATSTFGTDGSLNLASLGTFASGFVSQASSTVVGNFTSTGNGYFTGGLTLASTTINPTYAGSGNNSTALTFNAPSAIGVNTTTLGYGVGITTPILQLVNTGAQNTFGITNTNLNGIAAITFRGPDNSYTSTTTVFEHGAIGWLPSFGSGTNTGQFFIEASRYDAQNNPLIPPPDFALEQTGGIDPTGGTNVTCTPVQSNTSMSCTMNGGANGTLVVGTGIPPATTVSSGGGTTSIVLSAAPTSSPGAETVNFSSPTYAQRDVMDASVTGNGLVKFAGWDGTNVLNIDRVNKWVGILTTAPTVPLDVAGNARVAGTLTFAGSSYGIVSPGNIFHIGDVDSATPVQQTLGFQNTLTGTSNTAGGNIFIRGSLGTGTGAGGSLFFQTSPAGGSGTSQNAAVTRMTVLNNGQVIVSSGSSSFGPENGAGTPLFQVQSAVNNPRNNAIAVYAYGASATAPANLYLEQSNSNTLGTQTAVAANTTLGQITVGGSDGTNFQNSSRILGAVDGAVSAGIVPGRLVFQTANSAGTLAEAMRITSAGYVGIGTTSPSARLTVWGSDTASTTAFNVVNSASTTVFAVYDSGNSTYSGAIFQSSDQRLKTNVQSLDSSSALSAIEQLNPVSYTRIDQPGLGENLGFIAQQLGDIFPELVSTTSPTALTPDGTLTLNYTGLIAPIVAAIQEIASISGAFRDNLIAWLGNSANGIENLFAKSIYATNITAHQITADLLCAGTVCINQQQLASLLATQGAGQGSTGASIATSTPSGPPVIQINGDNPATVNVGATYNDLGATVSDPTADLNLRIQAIVDGGATTTLDQITIDTTQPGTHTIQYVATDQAGLIGTATRTVIVAALTAPPTAAITTPATDTATSTTP